MFSFFGAFAVNESPTLAENFHERWPDADLVDIEKPFDGLAIRFKESIYKAGSEELPVAVSAAVQEVSQQNPNTRIILLRTECWGGICENWGEFILNGQTVVAKPFVEYPECKGTLRELIKNLGVDIGPKEVFEPLCRDFPWEAKQ